MRINENNHAHHETYNNKIQKRVEDVLDYAIKIMELRRLLSEIRKESIKLKELFWNDDELKAKRDAVNFFDARMQAMAYYTLHNLEKYQQQGWKELTYGGGNIDE
jgi:hypothetical protein